MSTELDFGEYVFDKDKLLAVMEGHSPAVQAVALTNALAKVIGQMAEGKSGDDLLMLRDMAMRNLAEAVEPFYKM